MADESLLRPTMVTGVQGVDQLVKIVHEATPEMQRLARHECDVIIECRFCRNLFRSLVNFLCHKRSYCRGSHQRWMAIAEDSPPPEQKENDSELPGCSRDMDTGCGEDQPDPRDAAGRTPMMSGRLHGRRARPKRQTKADAPSAHLRTLNPMGRLLKRVGVATLKDAQGHNTLQLHTLPSIGKIVPETQFENGFQMVVDRDKTIPNLAKKDTDKRAQDQNVLMVMPQDMSSRYLGMSLRNRAGNSTKETTKELTKEEIDMIDRMGDKKVSVDPAEMACTSSTCLQGHFSSVSVLAYHATRVHNTATGAEHKMCFVCGRTYRKLTAIHSHLATVHAELGQKHEAELTAVKTRRVPIERRAAAGRAPTQVPVVLSRTNQSPLVEDSPEEESDHEVQIRGKKNEDKALKAAVTDPSSIEKADFSTNAKAATKLIEGMKNHTATTLSSALILTKENYAQQKSKSSSRGETDCTVMKDAAVSCETVPSASPNVANGKTVDNSPILERLLDRLKHDKDATTMSDLKTVNSSELNTNAVSTENSGGKNVSVISESTPNRQPQLSNDTVPQAVPKFADSVDSAVAPLSNHPNPIPSPHEDMDSAPVHSSETVPNENSSSKAVASMLPTSTDFVAVASRMEIETCPLTAEENMDTITNLVKDNGTTPLESTITIDPAPSRLSGETSVNTSTSSSGEASASDRTDSANRILLDEDGLSIVLQMESPNPESVKIGKGGHFCNPAATTVQKISENEQLNINQPTTKATEAGGSSGATENRVVEQHTNVPSQRNIPVQNGDQTLRATDRRKHRRARKTLRRLSVSTSSSNETVSSRDVASPELGAISAGPVSHTVGSAADLAVAEIPSTSSASCDKSVGIDPSTSLEWREPQDKADKKMSRDEPGIAMSKALRPKNESVPVSEAPTRSVSFNFRPSSLSCTSASTFWTSAISKESTCLASWPPKHSASRPMQFDGASRPTSSESDSQTSYLLSQVKLETTLGSLVTCCPPRYVRSEVKVESPKSGLMPCSPPKDFSEIVLDCVSPRESTEIKVSISSEQNDQSQHTPTLSSDDPKLIVSQDTIASKDYEEGSGSVSRSSNGSSNRSRSASLQRTSSPALSAHRLDADNWLAPQLLEKTNRAEEMPELPVSLPNQATDSTDSETRQADMVFKNPEPSPAKFKQTDPLSSAETELTASGINQNETDSGHLEPVSLPVEDEQQSAARCTVKRGRGRPAKSSFEAAISAKPQKNAARNPSKYIMPLVKRDFFSLSINSTYSDASDSSSDRGKTTLISETNSQQNTASNLHSETAAASVDPYLFTVEGDEHAAAPQITTTKRGRGRPPKSVGINPRDGAKSQQNTARNRNWSGTSAKSLDSSTTTQTKTAINKIPPPNCLNAEPVQLSQTNMRPGVRNSIGVYHSQPNNDYLSKHVQNSMAMNRSTALTVDAQLAKSRGEIYSKAVPAQTSIKSGPLSSVPWKPSNCHHRSKVVTNVNNRAPQENTKQKEFDGLRKTPVFMDAAQEKKVMEVISDESCVCFKCKYTMEYAGFVPKKRMRSREASITSLRSLPPTRQKFRQSERRVSERSVKSAGKKQKSSSSHSPPKGSVPSKYLCKSTHQEPTQISNRSSSAQAKDLKTAPQSTAKSTVKETADAKTTEEQGLSESKISSSSPPSHQQTDGTQDVASQKGNLVENETQNPQMEAGRRKKACCRIS